MRNNTKKFLALVLSLVMMLGMLPAASAVRVEDRAADLRTEFTRPEEVADVIDPEEWVTVIVELEGETTLDVDEFADEFRQDSVGYSADASVAAYRASMVDTQNEVQTQIAAMVPEAEFRFHYTNLLNGFAARVQYKDIAAIESLDGVLDVYMTQSYDYSDYWEEDEDTIEYISLEEYYDLYDGDGIDLDEGYYTDASTFSDQGSVDQMHLQDAWDRGYTGAGKVVGVFDSSLRYTHELFSYMDPEIAEEQPGNYKTKENLLAASRRTRAPSTCSTPDGEAGSISALPKTPASVKRCRPRFGTAASGTTRRCPSPWTIWTATWKSGTVTAAATAPMFPELPPATLAPRILPSPFPWRM